MIKTVLVFKGEKTFVRYIVKSEICSSVFFVLFHSSIFAFSSVQFDQSDEEIKQGTCTG